MKLPGIKHIFWDLDHTLWDFDSNAHDTLVALYHEFDLAGDINASVDEFIAVYKQINDRCWDLYRRGEMEKDELRTKRYKLTFEHFGSNNEAKAADLGWAYMKICPTKTKVMPGAFKVLDALKGKYQQHIITNGFKEVQGVKQSGSGLAPYFNVVVCSEDVGKKKPHSDVFWYAMNKAGAKPEESIMIGDGLQVDAIGAEKVGMKGVWYNPLRQRVEHEVWEINHLEELLEKL